MRMLFFVLLLSSLFVDAAWADATEPDDPNALYALVLKSQGLNFPGVKPWHIRASYTVFDTKGSHPVNGVFEEWWMGPHKYKRSYIRSGFTQTDYATEAGLYRVGDQKWATQQELSIPTNLTEPLPDLQGIKEFTLKKVDFSGSAKLRCIALTYSFPLNSLNVAEAFPTYCVDPGGPVLRLSVPHGPRKETTYNRILIFQGHYLAGDIQTSTKGKTALTLTIDVLESLPNSQDGLFALPSDAVLLPQGKVSLSEGSVEILREVAPVFPTTVKVEHIDGTIHMQVTIERNGRVQEVQNVDGPTLLRQGAIDAVHQWIFRPFLVSGDPVEVDTEVGIIFRLSR
jgi:hypothetical protein